MIDTISVQNRIEEIKLQLQLHGNGANAHTANKARCYIGQFPTVLLPLCEAALANGKWKELGVAMSRLW